MLIEEAFCEDGELRRHAQRTVETRRIFLQRGDVSDIRPRFGDGKFERAIPEAKRIVQDDDAAVRAALLFDDVYACDAEVHAALPHADDNIARALEDDPQLRQGGNFCLILARVGLEHAQTGGGEKIERIAFEASFGRKGEAEGGLGCHGLSLIEIVILGGRPPTIDHCLLSAVGGLEFAKQKTPTNGRGLTRYGATACYRTTGTRTETSRPCGDRL